jgi:hypothetical protein
MPAKAMNADSLAPGYRNGERSVQDPRTQIYLPQWIAGWGFRRPAANGRASALREDDAHGIHCIVQCLPAPTTVPKPRSLGVIVGINVVRHLSSKCDLFARRSNP